MFRITIIVIIIVSYVINIARSNDDYSLPLRRRRRRGARDDDSAAAEIPLLFYTSAVYRLDRGGDSGV